MPSRRQFLATSGALAASALAGCQTLTGSRLTSRDFPEGVVFEDGWRSPNHDDANTRTVLDGPTITEPTKTATLPPSDGGVTGADGRVFLVDDETLHAFDASSGESLWSVAAAGHHPPSVLGDTVYAPHPESPLLRGIDAASGEVVETYDLPARAVTPPAWSNGRESFTVALADGRVTGVARDVGDTWTVDPWGSVRASLASNMHLVVVTTRTGEVYAYSQRGGPAWRTNLGARGLVAPVAGDERVYVAGWDGTVAALSRTDGEVVWTRKRGVTDAPLAFDGRHLYHGTGDLVALDPKTGETDWSYEHPTGAAPAVVGDTVYVGRDDGVLAALDAASGEERWTRDLGSYAATVAVIDNALLVAGHTEETRRVTFLL
ncbi:PQQ-binding-like beta-propeller repeat protein [Halarchaeum sp. P4]|uniref:PQQ-binding-like beta-propeller repeat protein n=1 Tax=Halarchaeum sp. P4 TaxID=3421639 RepID=UPI003EC14695